MPQEMEPYGTADFSAQAPEPISDRRGVGVHVKKPWAAGPRLVESE